MEFDWDRANAGHVALHGISPEECEQAYQNGPITVERQRRNYERRRLCLGETNAGRLLALVVTERKGKIRFVTAYPMGAQQRKIYRGEQ